MNPRGERENLQHQMCFGRVGTFYKFIECLHACTLHCQVGARLLLSYASGVRIFSHLIFNSHWTDSSFLQGNIRGCRRRKTATPRKEKKKENSVKWACMIRLWGGTEKGRLQPELCIVGSPHHCDSTLKLISEFFASMTLGNLEVWCLTPLPTPSTHFPMQSSRCHRQTNKTYRISV